MKKTIIIVLSVIVLIASGFAFVRYRAQQSLSSMYDDLQTVEAGYGSLVATVGATGSVRANQSAILSWKTSGIVSQVYTRVGELVSEGELLADLVQTSLPQNVILAESELINAQKALEDLNKGYDTLALAQAQEKIASLEKSVANAKQTVYAVESPADQDDLDQAESTLVLARDRLEKAQSDWDKYKDSGNEVLVATMQGNLASAKSSYDSALYRYNSLKGGSTQIDIDNARADLVLAEALLANALTDLEKILAGPTANDIAAAEARVAAAQATLNMAYIEAPFSGTLTIVEPKPGDLVGMGTSAFRMDDLTRLLVDVAISEVDINRIHEGQTVILTFDAILAKEYQGKVIEVSQVGLPQQGLVSFKVSIEILDADAQVKPGMTSGVNIVVSELDNVLLVPNRAVRVEDGKRVVYVLSGNGLTGIETVEIELGVSSEAYSEVIGGELTEGDLIILNPPSNFMFDGPPGGGMFGRN